MVVVAKLSKAMLVFPPFGNWMRGGGGLMQRRRGRRDRAQSTLLYAGFVSLLVVTLELQANRALAVSALPAFLPRTGRRFGSSLVKPIKEVRSWTSAHRRPDMMQLGLQLLAAQPRDANETRTRRDRKDAHAHTPALEATRQPSRVRTAPHRTREDGQDLPASLFS